MSVTRYKRGASVTLSKNFSSSEFDCHCKKCNETLIDSRLVEKLEKLRSELRCPIKITSGYRCPGRQELLRTMGFETSEHKSSHEMGMAADVYVQGVSGVELSSAAEKAGFPSIGKSLTWIHVDIRGLDDGKQRRWDYKK